MSGPRRRPRAREYGHARGTGMVLAINLAESLLSLGRWDEAAEVIEHALELSPPPGRRAPRCCSWPASWRWPAVTCPGPRSRPLPAATHWPGAGTRTSITCRWPGSRSSCTWRRTAREVEVLRLVAAVRSNRDIAAELFISAKTASVHVSNVLAKLNAASRAEAAAIAVRAGLAAEDS